MSAQNQAHDMTDVASANLASVSLSSVRPRLAKPLYDTSGTQFLNCARYGSHPDFQIAGRTPIARSHQIAGRTPISSRTRLNKSIKSLIHVCNRLMNTCRCLVAGASNIVGSFFQSYPITASFSRLVINAIITEEYSHLNNCINNLKRTIISSPSWAPCWISIQPCVGAMLDGNPAWRSRWRLNNYDV